jgi:DNA-binding NarL/FixJ family response regulator
VATCGDTAQLAAAVGDLAQRIALEKPVASVRCSTHVGSSDYQLTAAAVSATVAGYDSIVVALQRELHASPSDSQLRDRFRLTPREIDVVRLLVTGMPNDEIAARLARSRYTVRRHTEKILAKLDVRRRAQVGVRLAEM